MPRAHNGGMRRCSGRGTDTEVINLNGAIVRATPANKSGAAARLLAIATSWLLEEGSEAIHRSHMRV